MLILKKFLLLAMFGLAIAACDSNDNPFEEAGENIDEAFEEVADEIDDATRN